MLKNTKRGSLGVEAAIFLPMLIVGILTIAYIIKINSMEENMMSIAADESRLLAMESYMDLGKTRAITFEKRLEQRINESNPKGAVTDVDNLRYLYSKKGVDKLISFDMEYSAEINFPINFYGRIDGHSALTARAFVGTSKYNTVKGFEAMEEEEPSEKVWIFPVSGEKYHDENCTYIKAAAVKSVLNSSLKRKYHSCDLCNSDELGKGSLVYYFPSSGRSYHKSTCSTVDKYVTEIEKKEAEERGYLPCLKCGG